MPPSLVIDKQSFGGAMLRTITAPGGRMEMIFAVQLLLPLGLVAWAAARPPASWIGWTLHLLAAAAVIAALMLAGLWTVLPWWLTMVFAALALVVLLRRRPARVEPAGWEWGGAVLLGALVLVAGWVAVTAWQGRRPPEAQVVELAWPLPPGSYRVVNGGTTGTVSSHVETLDLGVPRHRLFQGQSYGVDLVALNSAGRTTSSAWPVDPRRYAVYGRQVTAPCAGRVVIATEGVPDQPVPDPGEHARTGNGVLLRCANADVLLAHFAPGTVRVRAGEDVRVGQLLGQAGNSGSSNEPHLHIHAQRPGTPDAPLSGAPLPIRFDGEFLVRNERVSR